VEDDVLPDAINDHLRQVDGRGNLLTAICLFVNSITHEVTGKDLSKNSYNINQRKLY